MEIVKVDQKEWLERALLVAENHGRLLTLWAREVRSNRYSIYSVFRTKDDQLLCLELPISAVNPTYPDLSSLFPVANRLQRAIWDLLGIRAHDSSDTRHWLNHGSWIDGFFPLQKKFNGKEEPPFDYVDDYSFVEVTGEGVHEIGVGPVHAGIIEPGHFRFSVVGEKTLRLEERLGYVHKGIDKKFESFAAIEGAKLAGRTSGDSTVAYSWSYCMAIESAWKWQIPERAKWLRALLLERERIANHLGDLGAIGNDAGFAFALSQFMILKEQWLRTNVKHFGHRLLMDSIVPGGITFDLEIEGAAEILEQCDHIEGEVRTMQKIYEDHSGLQDRFVTTGLVSHDLAKELGLTGLAGRASGIEEDARTSPFMHPMNTFEFHIATAAGGDVAARVAVRFAEIFTSLHLIREIISSIPKGAHLSVKKAPNRATFGVGWVEGWRGGIFAAIHITGKGMIDRCHMHDPSWNNWPVLEYAVIGDIVPDFPLINKSFNLSYSGHDR